ncbi:hypothetical protein D3C87_1146810 [compost metagenome]
MFNTPLPVPASPSTSPDDPRSSCEPLTRLTASQLMKLAGRAVRVLSSDRVSLPTPPLTLGVSARILSSRLRRVTVSLPTSMRIVERIMPPPSHSKRSSPTLARTSPTISPPLTVMLSLPPLTLMLPPMRPPETIMVSVPKPVTRLPIICPPDRSKILLSSFMSTRPMVPPVMRATSPSSKAPTMMPPFIKNVSRLSP